MDSFWWHNVEPGVDRVRSGSGPLNTALKIGPSMWSMQPTCLLSRAAQSTTRNNAKMPHARSGFSVTELPGERLTWTERPSAGSKRFTSQSSHTCKNLRLCPTPCQKGDMANHQSGKTMGTGLLEVTDCWAWAEAEPPTTPHSRGQQEGAFAASVQSLPSSWLA